MKSETLLVFGNAKSFNFKTSLDSAWKSTNGYPGTGMFDGTCSEDTACGKCGKKNTDGDAVTCNPDTQDTKDASTTCTFCRDQAMECCPSKVSCDNIDGSGTTFLSTSCPLGLLEEDLTVKCLSGTCTKTHCCLYKPVPDCTSTSTDRTSGFRKVVDDWISGDAAKVAVVAKHGAIENWDLSQVRSMDSLFYARNTFDADIGKWDVSQVINMKR